jgi:hypothetical protein
MRATFRGIGQKFDKRNRSSGNPEEENSTGTVSRTVRGNKLGIVGQVAVRKDQDEEAQEKEAQLQAKDLEKETIEAVGIQRAWEHKDRIRMRRMERLERRGFAVSPTTDNTEDVPEDDTQDEESESEVIRLLKTEVSYYSAYTSGQNLFKAVCEEICKSFQCVRGASGTVESGDDGE